MKIFLILGGFLLLAFLGILAWLGLSEGNKNPEALTARVNEYWEAVKVNDNHTRYRLMTAYAEGKLQPDELRPQMSPQMRVLGYQVENVQVEDDGSARVVVDVTLTLPNFGGKGFHRKSRETWTYVGNDWYRGSRSEYREALKGLSEQKEDPADLNNGGTK